jgi:alkanesulfonate monooxygenase SsuD/methylene tetrahydromethanopterin reductase-like flavin-dependent oxidoreductase (luciferase family)
MSLPHRSPHPLALATIGTVARRAEELGLPELWVTENTVDDCACLDPVVALTFAPSITKRIGLGAAVIVLRSITADGGPSVGNPRFH